MKQDALILVRGGGDLATGTIHRLWSAGCGCLYWKPLTRRLSGGRCHSAKLCTKVKQR